MKILRWVFVIPLLIILLAAVPAYAADPPDSISIGVKYVNRNLIETGDQVYYAIYDIDYTSLPDENIDDLFVFRLVDTDGTTELGSNEAYPFENQGFGKGVISFYFNAAGAPTWGQNYYIRVQGKPGFFDAPPDQLFIINVGDYTTSTTQADNQTELRNNIISAARTLEDDWTPITSLLMEIETGTMFNVDGEDYFRNAISGIQSMCPQLFESQIIDVTYEDRTWNTTQQTAYESRTAGTSIGTGIQGLSDVFSLDFNIIASLPILLACILCIVASVKMKGKPESGMLCSLALIIFGGFMGWTPFALIAVASTICFLYIAMILIGRIPT